MGSSRKLGEVAKVGSKQRPKGYVFAGTINRVEQWVSPEEWEKHPKNSRSKLQIPKPADTYNAPVSTHKPAVKSTSPLRVDRVNKNRLRIWDPVKTLLQEREMEYAGRVEIIRNDMSDLEELAVAEDNSELRKQIRRGRSALVSEPGYTLENIIYNSTNPEQAVTNIYNWEDNQRTISRPAPHMEAHHPSAIGAFEAQTRNMHMQEIRATQRNLTGRGYHLGSEAHGFMPLSKPAHTTGGTNWGTDFAHVGVDGTPDTRRFIPEQPFPKGTTPSQAADLIKPSLDEQLVLNNKAWNHPAEAAMRRYVEEVYGIPVQWQLPLDKKTLETQKTAIGKAGIKNTGSISTAFANGFAEGKTYSQVAETLNPKVVSSAVSNYGVPKQALAALGFLPAVGVLLDAGDSVAGTHQAITGKTAGDRLAGTFQAISGVSGLASLSPAAPIAAPVSMVSGALAIATQRRADMDKPKSKPLYGAPVTARIVPTAPPKSKPVGNGKGGVSKPVGVKAKSANKPLNLINEGRWFLKQLGIKI
jgi:hypothetical protein